MIQINKKKVDYRKLFVNISCLFFIGVMVWTFTQRFGCVINLTESLPYKIFIVHLKQLPSRGDYVLFAAPAGSLLPKGTKLTKQVLGCEGDSISAKGLDYFINGKWVATAKTHSLQGVPLQPGPVGQLGKGQYYVGTQHQDSFDSRYQRMGWISQTDIMGVAYPIW